MTEKKMRCSHCRKKLKLISYSCKCGGVYCPQHRYTHTHNCTHYEKIKNESKENIQKLNPKTEAEKVIKIN